MRRVVRPLPSLVLLAFVALGGVGCSAPTTEPDAQSSPGPEEPSEPERSTGPAHQQGGPAPDRVTAVALPPVAQPGTRPGSVDPASGLVVAQVRPPTPAGVVRLERRQGDRWRLVRTARQDRSGHATFTGLEVATSTRYRAVVPSDGQDVASAPVEFGDWSSVFADDFDGSALDRARWDHRLLGIYNADGGRECSKSDPSAVAVADGTLRLLVRADPARAGQTCRSADGTHDYYLNGHVSTEGRFDFTYGVAAARVRFQEGRGQHGAFWMQRQVARVVPGDAEVSGAEIDIAEFFGKGYPEGGLASFAYYLNDANENEKIGGVHPEATRQLPPGDDWWSSYHVFSVEWTPERYVFRVDGREIFRTDEGVSGVDQFLVLSLLSSDWELGRLDRSMLPSRMEVDWVRVWQQDSP